ncbi:hypothetical protein CVT25_010960 [Psilocybe cyanescens]|uniref:Protein YTP1-like C-terminal domain-containing protein n=1 Tax=Psilocybe cyanescens TaxID=93625 RepID=A0A409WFT3_PSICY|nr:hypothetical protein CVT25_010960 [Psilocybe cyanescens]
MPHLRWVIVLPLLCIALCVLAVPSSDHPSSLAIRDGHEHQHAHGVPLLELNETQVIMYHAPTPPSYYTLDFEDEGYQKRHKGLMIFHGIFMCLAFFVSLPVGIALRSVNHAAHSLATFSFYVFCVLGCAASGLYRKLTPNMYEGPGTALGAVHGSQGYYLILVAISLSTLDIIAAIQRFIAFLKSPDKSLKTFWRHVVRKEEIDFGASPEYVGLIADEPEDFTTPKTFRHSVEMHDVELNDIDRSHTEQWADAVHRHQKNYSMASEATVFGTHSPGHSQDTLHDSKSRPKSLSRFERLQSIGRIAFATVERTLVAGGFAQLLLGIVTYSAGGCRENYLNGCLAHLIKGGIFWCYGLLTFARFLGSYADRGWAWNRSPSGDSYTAEFLESFVIFLYGATNTWMERFGANPGDPFTTKQIQHISIAVMFCFAGLVGMGIESKRIRKWLASSAFSLSSHSDVLQEAVVEPLSYIGSFNPFPALVIGVTGAAMAAHAQTYLFQASECPDSLCRNLIVVEIQQVQIHSLWGNLLMAFSVLRCLTYFFLWLGPPQSILPSRPPTEALGSFFLACGGLVFMFSTEEVTIAAMRRGRDDVMMFLNLAVALTCLAFCWTLFVVGFKGWIKSQTQPSVTYRHAA